MTTNSEQVEFVITVKAEGAEQVDKLRESFKKLSEGQAEDTKATAKADETRDKAARNMKRGGLTGGLREMGEVFSRLNPKVAIAALGLGAFVVTLNHFDKALQAQLTSTTTLGIAIGQYTGQLWDYEETVEFVAREQERLNAIFKAMVPDVDGATATIEDIEAAYRVLLPTVWDMSTAQDLLTKATEIHIATGTPLLDVVQRLNSLWKEGDFFMTDLGGKMLFGAEAVKEFHRRAMEVTDPMIQFKNAADAALDASLEDVMRDLNVVMGTLTTTLKVLAVTILGPLIKAFTWLFDKLGITDAFYDWVESAREGADAFDKMFAAFEKGEGLDMDFTPKIDVDPDESGSVLDKLKELLTPGAENLIPGVTVIKLGTFMLGLLGLNDEGEKNDAKNQINTETQRLINEAVAQMEISATISNLDITFADVAGADGNQDAWAGVLEDFEISPNITVSPNFIYPEHVKEAILAWWDSLFPPEEEITEKAQAIPPNISGAMIMNWHSGLVVPTMGAAREWIGDSVDAATTEATGETGFTALPGDIWSAMLPPFQLDLVAKYQAAIVTWQQDSRTAAGNTATDNSTGFPTLPGDIWSAMSPKFTTDLRDPYRLAWHDMLAPEPVKESIDTGYSQFGVWLMAWIQPAVNNAKSTISSLRSEISSLQAQAAAARRAAVEAQTQYTRQFDPGGLAGGGQIPEHDAGGVFFGPSLGIIAEKRPEVVAPLEELPRLLGAGGGGAGGGLRPIQIFLNGRMIEEVTTEEQDLKVRLRGAR